jgi:hypothetical protein
MQGDIIAGIVIGSILVVILLYIALFRLWAFRRERASKRDIGGVEQSPDGNSLCSDYGVTPSPNVLDPALSDTSPQSVPTITSVLRRSPSSDR